jgi:hypothetical protein
MWVPDRGVLIQTTFIPEASANRKLSSDALRVAALCDLSKCKTADFHPAAKHRSVEM